MKRFLISLILLTTLLTVTVAAKTIAKQDLDSNVAYIGTQGNEKKQGERQYRSRQNDEKISFKLVTHCAALTAARGNGRIRDERKIIAKHRAAHDRADTKRH